MWRGMTGSVARSPWWGVVLVMGAVTLWASIGVLVRAAHSDVWTILFWRSGAGGLTLLLFALARSRLATIAEFRAVRGAGLAYAAALGVGTLLYVPALHMASVAEVSVIYATVPLLTALIAWLWSGERSDRVTILAGLSVIPGIALSVGGGVGIGHGAGNLLAGIVTLAYALQMVILRRHNSMPIVPAVCVAALLVVVASAPFAAPLSAPVAEVGCLALSGVASGALADVLFARGAQLLPPTRAALLTLLEGPLGTLFVWVVIAECPPLTAVAGGLIVLTAVGTTLVLPGRDALSRDGREAAF